MPDQPYPPIQARELMNPLPGHTRREWQDMPQSERESLIRESRAQFQTEGSIGSSGAQPGGQAAGAHRASPDFPPEDRERQELGPSGTSPQLPQGDAAPPQGGILENALLDSGIGLGGEPGAIGATYGEVEELAEEELGERYTIEALQLLGAKLANKGLMRIGGHPIMVAIQVIDLLKDSHDASGHMRAGEQDPQGQRMLQPGEGTQPRTPTGRDDREDEDGVDNSGNQSSVIMPRAY
jgi:hypothetical protein